MKNGDFYSYATVSVQSHGFMIQAGHDHHFRIEVNTIFNRPFVELKNTRGIAVIPEQINKLIWDTRLQQDGCYLMVYKSGKTCEEVLEMINPQLVQIITNRKKDYETLASNSQKMIDALKSPHTSEFICKGELL